VMFRVLHDELTVMGKQFVSLLVFRHGHQLAARTHSRKETSKL
jgi:hypothetical protein